MGGREGERERKRTFINFNYLAIVDFILQLSEIWVESVSQSPDKKVKEECSPGKPITVFSSTPHKVRRL